MTKLTNEQIEKIKAAYECGVSQRKLAVAFGVSQPRVGDIVNGKARVKEKSIICIKVGNETRSFAEWADIIGVKVTSIRGAIARGEDAAEYISSIRSGKRIPKRPKLTREKAEQIRRDYANDKRISHRQLGEKYGVTHGAIWKIVNGVVWSKEVG